MFTSSPKIKTSARIIRDKKGSARRKAAVEQVVTSKKQGTEENQSPEILVQPKLRLGAVDSPLEREADQMAYKAVGGGLSVNQGFLNDASSFAQQKGEEDQIQGFLEEKEGVQTKVKDDFVQAKSVEKGSLAHQKGAQEVNRKKQTKETLQAKQDGGAIDMLPAGFAAKMNAALHLGKPLPESVQAQMEALFGADFSEVSVHDHPTATELNEMIHAYAFTHQNHIFFNEGKYNPHSTGGLFLLAHELTHTLQQGAVPFGLSGPTLEKDADQIQASFADGVVAKVVDISTYFNISVEELITYIPGYDFFSYIVQYDFVRQTKVGRNTENLIKGIVGLFPFGKLLFDQIKKYELIDQVAGFLQEKLKDFGLSFERIGQIIEAAYQEMELFEGVAGNLKILKQHFLVLFHEAKHFLKGLIDAVWEQFKVALIKPLASYLQESVPAYTLLTKVLKYDPVTEEPVVATTEEVLADFLLLIGKEKELDEMRKKGTLQRTANWIDKNLARFMGLSGRFLEAFQAEWNELDLQRDLSNPRAAFERLKNRFLPLLKEAFDFAIEVAAKVLEIIKNALLGALRSFAEERDGYTLITVILGKDPFTREVVERSIMNLVKGFILLTPGGETRFQEIEESGVIPNAVDRLWTLVEGLGLSYNGLRARFKALWDSFEIIDLVNPVTAYIKIFGLFADLITKLFVFVAKVVLVLVEVLFVMMGVPPDLISSTIAKVEESINLIKENPIGFLRNLLLALKLGFQQFFGNILDHLFGGLKEWLFGELRKAGVEPPEEFTLASIFSMTLSVLGITLENVMARLEEKIGPEKMAQINGALDKLSGIWTFVKDVQERGVVAIFEYIGEQISNLWNIVIGSIQEWIQSKVIDAAVEKLLSMLDPTGITLIIQSFVAFFKAVQSFLEKLAEILAMIRTFFNGVADIAKGSLKTAANFLEQALADGIPVALAFLANQIGLGDLGQKLKEMFGNARAMINQAIDWLIEKALQAGLAVKDFGEEIVGKVKNFFGVKSVVEVQGGESHSIYYKDKNNSMVLMINSNPQALKDFLYTYSKQVKGNKDKESLIVDIKKEIEINVLLYKKRRKTQKDYDELINQRVTISKMLSSLLKGDRKVGLFIASYLLEGEVGTYGSLPKARGDILTPDHQPQKAILQYASELKVGGKEKLFKKGSELEKRARGTKVSKGYSILLHEIRHSEGRTFGHKGKDTKTEFVNTVKDIPQEKITEEAMRVKVVQEIRNAMESDVRAIEEMMKPSNSKKAEIWGDILGGHSKYNDSNALNKTEKKEVINDTRKQILAGEKIIERQPLDILAKE